MEEGKIFVWQAEVLANKEMATGISLLTLACPQASQYQPGQLLCVEPLHFDSVMARPFSIFEINPLRQEISILYKVVGCNTLKMHQLLAGQTIKAWGPLGSPFYAYQILSPYKKVWFVAGGIGIAAIHFIQQWLYKPEVYKKIFWGNKLKEQIIPIDFGKVPLIYATDDGSAGYKGLITDLLDQVITGVENLAVLSCGPKPMLKKVAAICAEQKVPCWVCLERTFACGFGVCLGCTIQTSHGPQRICTEGPWFKAEEVNDELNS